MTKIIKSGAIDILLNIMKTHIINVKLCKRMCNTLWIMSEGSCSTQREVCEKDGLNILLEIMKKHDDDIDLPILCCSAIGVLLSTKEVHSKYCTPDILNTVRECYEQHKSSEQLKQFLLGITREEDERVKKAVTKNICTKEAFPKCSDNCKCDENRYCSRCFVQQKVFRCRTCDKNEMKLYCETCWKRDHQGHDCEEFFHSMRCSATAK